MSRQEQPLVSIIIPCFNCEKHVSEAVESALKQTYSPTEIIVIDDGSSDGSVKKIKSFGEKVRLIQTENRGASAARNLGISIAKGSLIQFLDADDILFPEKLVASVPSFSGVSVGIVFGNSCSFFEGKEEKCHLDPNYPWPVADLPAQLIPDNIQTSRGVYRKEVLEKFGGFNERLSRAQEFELNFRLAVNGVKFVYLPGVLGVKIRYHKSPHRISIKARDDPDLYFDLRLYQHFASLAAGKGKLSLKVREAIATKLKGIAKLMEQRGEKSVSEDYLRAARDLEIKDA